MADNLFENLYDVLHAPARLGIMTILLSEGETDFTSLRKRLGLTDGNLGAHIRVLEEAGYVQVDKMFVARRPKTVCKLTNEGKQAFRKYLRRLESVIRKATSQAEKN